MWHRRRRSIARHDAAFLVVGPDSRILSELRADPGVGAGPEDVDIVAKAGLHREGRPEGNRCSTWIDNPAGLGDVRLEFAGAGLD